MGDAMPGAAAAYMPWWQRQGWRQSASPMGMQRRVVKDLHAQVPAGASAAQGSGGQLMRWKEPGGGGASSA